ncbi:WYL domain-containing protein [Periweissella ghanensis]|uniref:WYL domain-containing protein n=1 Tax=Periweissella ghanensis TaxID=467997 RepID=A0ABM8ZBV3_9LACO|nr:WYL domain-containing protein [Periweissella ghanensis]MCM0600562.1 WYL domain-containing protein [Periweissella ghanensis]CAH0418355.1 hypothetical protein WGH24286_00773 [Periweissella ghanensis]
MTTGDSKRLLDLLLKLLAGEKIGRDAWLESNHLKLRTVQNDFKDIAIAIGDDNPRYAVVRANKTIAITRKAAINEKHILAICKILLASRAFTKLEKDALITSMLALGAAENTQLIKHSLANETNDYKPVHHGKNLLDLIWQFNTWIEARQVLSFDYERMDHTNKADTALPIGLFFDTYYFYIIMQREQAGKNFQAFYRIDRFNNIRTNNRVKISHPASLNTLEENKIRKTNNLMQLGHSTPIEFDFTGNPEAALDKFPDAQITDKKVTNGVHIKIPNANQNGAMMWFLSQGHRVKVTSPVSLVNAIQTEIAMMRALY